MIYIIITPLFTLMMPLFIIDIDISLFAISPPYAPLLFFITLSILFFADYYLFRYYYYCFRFHYYTLSDYYYASFSLILLPLFSPPLSIYYYLLHYAIIIIIFATIRHYVISSILLPPLLFSSSSIFIIDITSPLSPFSFRLRHDDIIIDDFFAYFDYFRHFLDAIII